MSLSVEKSEGGIGTGGRSMLVDRIASPLSRTLTTVVVPTTIALLAMGLISGNLWLGLMGGLGALGTGLWLLTPFRSQLWTQLIPVSWRVPIAGALGSIIGVFGLLLLWGTERSQGEQGTRLSINWDAVGAISEALGALGQIAIAVLAVYVAWQQYVLSRDLTIQQNRITQQQTIDAYFQGVSDLALDEQGFLEDWPQERAIAEGRTAAILGSVDAEGKAKIVRFLSQAKLVTPLKRDRLLGRPILDGSGGYEEDRARGVRVIDLGVMLAGADLQGTDLRWVDLGETNLVRADLSGCNLTRANLSRTILFEANLRGADLKGVRLFYGNLETTTPRSREDDEANYQTGEGTGAVIENADLSGAVDLSETDRVYCCMWGGERTRGTIPGGCEGIENKLGR
ncbi:pentapeptide repeat-containing protein [Limnothrix redekei LRLZ20PSL1]|uniref:Pentapeptide repeat-containing protein n=2 Tax=Limnothrix TaxID=132605 RepID=A0ABW7C4V7_9CYAN